MGTRTNMKSFTKESTMKISLSMLSCLGILFAGCNQKAGKEKEAAPSPPEASAAPSPRFAAPDTFKAGLGKVYEGYGKIESALAHDDFPKAMEAFQSMHGILHMLQTEGLDSAGKAHWKALDSSLMAVLHPMAAAKDIGEMRNHFIGFSPLMLDALESFGAKSAARAFLFHCPMARNNQGADWLQSDSVLLNPYYGKQMPGCGNLIREVPLF